MSLRKSLVLFFVLAAIPVFSQTPEGAFGVSNDAVEQMAVPYPVSSEGPSLAYSSKTPPTNYVRGGLIFGSAFDDNILGGGNRPVSDFSYSVQPTLSWAQSTSRLNWILSYSPGFTFYQHTTSRNQASHSLALEFKYRLTPHVTLSLKEDFLKTSNYFSQFDQTTLASPTSLLRSSNVTVIAPLANQINDTSVAQLAYQFSPNGMVGATGTFSELRYPNRAEVPGLFDSSAKAAEGFYTRRVSGKHYIGATYQFQSLLALPGEAETQTHSVVLFYTIYLQPNLSLSVFAGPQHSTTQVMAPATSSSMWSPEVGGSFTWQGARTSFAAEVAKKISQGGGLPGAVRSQGASASIRRQLSKNVGATLGANYASNGVLDSLFLSNNGGHLLAGSVSLQHHVGEHLNLEIGYARLHQTYADIPGIPNALNRNRVSVSLSYEFQRPLGR